LWDAAQFNLRLHVFMHIDFFDFFRWVLGTVVTIYATVVTVQSLYTWWVYFGGEGRYLSLMRRYIMLQGLRLRIRTFGGDVLICALLAAVWVLLLRAHQMVAKIDPYSHGDGRDRTTTR
jgi:membrane-associated phospholipid phosphatase